MTRSLDGQFVLLPFDSAAHSFEYVDEAHVALDAGRPETAQRYRTAGDRGCREEVGRVAGVGLYGVAPALISLGRRDDEPRTVGAERCVVGRRLAVLLHYGHTKMIHEGRGHSQIRQAVQ